MILRHGHPTSQPLPRHFPKKPRTLKQKRQQFRWRVKGQLAYARNLLSSILGAQNEAGYNLTEEEHGFISSATRQMDSAILLFHERTKALREGKENSWPR